MPRKYPSLADIEEMKSRGYDISSINEAIELAKRGQVVEEVKEAIRNAFCDVRLGSGIGLFEAQGLDDYADEQTCAAYREKDEKENWQTISADNLNKCHSSLSFFDAEGMQFHLPAYLIADLNNEYHHGMAFALTQATGLSETFFLLNDKQRAAVRKYLEFIKDEPDYSYHREHIENALSDYWSD